MSTTWTCWRDPAHETTIQADFGWPLCMVCGAAPPYHERPSFLDERLELCVFVPKQGTPFWEGGMIAPRSGIVGLPMNDERLVIYYEGWVNGPQQYGDRNTRGLWEAGIQHAAGRMICQYPTVAVMSPRSEDFEAIGTYNPTTRVIDVANEALLERWLA